MLGSQTLPQILGPGGIGTMPAVYFNHFVTAFYCPNAALANESNPAAEFAEVADRGAWLVTRDAAPAIIVKDAEPGGVLRITPGTSANDFVSCQLNGEAFAVAANRRIWFEARFKTNDADDIKFFLGLCSTDVTGSTAGPILDGTNDSIGFRNVLGNTTTFLCLTEDDATETTSTAGTLADDTFTTVALEVIGTDQVKFYVNGALVARHTANLPDAAAALTLSMEVGSPTGTTATTLEVDYIWCSQEPV